MTWEISDHLCRVCLGRVLTSTGADGVTVARCSYCGNEHQGEPQSICCCGVRLAARCDTCGKQHHSAKVGAGCVAEGCSGVVVKGPSAGLRCVPNDSKSVEFPGEVVVAATGG